MNTEEYYDKLIQITGDRSKSIDDRITAAFEYKQSLRYDDDEESARGEAMCMGVIVAMIDREVKDHGYDTELMQALTLQAEAVVRGRIERTLGNVAERALHLLDNSGLPYELIEEALPRIIEAMKSSVYHNSRCRLMMKLLHRTALESHNGRKYDKELASGMARDWLNLYLLLDPDNRPAMDMTVYDFVAGLLTDDEIRKIKADPREGTLHKDPVEYTRRWEEIYYDVVDELDRRFADTPRGMGFCFGYWHAMADLLSEKYGVDWRNPHLMNPRVMFD